MHLFIIFITVSIDELEIDRLEINDLKKGAKYLAPFFMQRLKRKN
jgi:hypothetical protein